VAILSGVRRSATGERALRGVEAGLLAAVLLAGTARGGAIAVNSLVDSAAPADGLCTLREAIAAANTNAASGGVSGECAAGEPGPARDEIYFAVAGAIQPTSPLPTVIGPTLINGVGNSGNPNAPCPSYLPVPTVELDGTNAGGDGLRIAGGASAVRGLAINRFSGSGIFLTGAGGNRVECNLVGTDPAGEIDLGNGGGGVAVDGSDGNVVGTDGDGSNDGNEGNLISGNDQMGVFLASEAEGNRVSGNRIGTNAGGTEAIANASYGVWINSSSDNVVGTDGDGTADATEGNLISGNEFSGVYIDSECQQNRISGNRIGTNAEGTAALPNFEWGIYLGASSTLIGTNGDGTSDALEGNLISGNLASGILVSGLEAQENRISGNRIGTNAEGTAAVSNHIGVDLSGQANHNVVGTNGDGAADEVEGNLISGNRLHGVRLAGTLGPINWPPFENRISGNRVGTTAEGTAALPNQHAGIFVGAGAYRNVVGANGDGIGESAEGNVVAFNGLAGVAIVDGVWGSSTISTLRARLSRNSVSSNSGLGIDLGDDGLSANDIGDADSGANHLQNFPEVQSAALGGGALLIVYTVPSPPPLEIEFFLSDSDGEEGATFLGGTNYVAAGNAVANLPAGIAALGDRLVATATDADGNSSEFSLAVTVVAGQANAIFIDGFQSGDTLAWNLCVGCASR
jgi:CSLREA domain-containing protein